MVAGLRAVLCAQLAADDEDVLLDRADRHDQRCGNGGIRGALRQQAQHFELALGEWVEQWWHAERNWEARAGKSLHSCASGMVRQSVLLVAATYEVTHYLLKRAFRLLRGILCSPANETVRSHHNRTTWCDAISLKPPPIQIDQIR